MHTTGSHFAQPGSVDRDPATVQIEAQLRELARDVEVEVHFDSTRDGMVEVSFGTVIAQGESRDIAIVRLASALLDDPRFAPRLIHILESVVGQHALEA